jgi:hypothetical protein
VHHDAVTTQIDPTFVDIAGDDEVRRSEVAPAIFFMPTGHRQREKIDVFAFEGVFHHWSGLDDSRRNEFLIVEAFFPRLDELIAAIVEWQVRRETLPLERLMMHADEHSMTGWVIYDFIEEDGRVGLVARVHFGDRAHF